MFFPTGNIANPFAAHLTEILFFAPNLMIASNIPTMHFFLTNSNKMLSLFKKLVDSSKSFAFRPFQLQILTRRVNPPTDSRSDDEQLSKGKADQVRVPIGDSSIARKHQYSRTTHRPRNSSKAGEHMACGGHPQEGDSWMRKNCVQFGCDDGG
jgi:hypothetical protein